MAERLSNLFQFIDVQRVDPAKKPVPDRILDFREIYGDFDAEHAALQSHRCLH